MKNTYLIGNIFEDDLTERKIKTNPELIFKELERLKVENNTLHQKDDDGLKKMVLQLVHSQNTIQHQMGSIYSIFENTGDVKPIKSPVKKRPTFKEQIKAEFERRKAAETQTILKEVYQKIV